jgi:hypothetical protein
MRRDSSVGEVTGYGLDDQASILGRGSDIFFATASIPALRPTYPRGTGTLSLGVKRPENEADH